MVQPSSLLPSSGELAVTLEIPTMLNLGPVCWSGDTGLPHAPRSHNVVVVPKLLSFVLCIFIVAGSPMTEE